jgi:colanic acid/amylovoran biosynthesis glycosyltransferase
MDLVYVTSRFPFGPGEGFLGPEIAAHLESGANLRLFPMWPKGGSVHSYARDYRAITDWAGPLPAAASALRGAAAAPSEFAKRAVLASTSGRLAGRGRNIAVLPRAAALVDVLRRRRPDHLHAHWGGASSTVAMIASEVTGTPWSMTLHRWDIRANNLLARKISSACFTRVISVSGAAQVAAIVPTARPLVIHMGIQLPASSDAEPAAKAKRIACIATLVPVKNHLGLLDAFREGLGDQDVVLDLIGDGPLREELRAHAARLGLASRVRFLGTLDHGEVMRRLRSHEWSAVVLASSATDEAQEGVPVSLMEAMASLVPVVATDSGGTGELVGAGAGLLVPVGDRAALANALRTVVTDAELRRRLAHAGRRRVADSFDVEVVAAELREHFSGCAA